jgi:hypothetical protein
VGIRLIAITGVAAAGLVVAGCGSSSTSNGSTPSSRVGPAQFIASAAVKSTGTPSMKTDLTVSMLSSKLPGGRVDMTATGALDNANHRMNMRLDMSKLVTQFGGAAAALGSPGEWVGEEVGDFGNGRAVMYMRLPALAKVIPGGKPWVKMDLNAIGSQAGIDLSQFTQFINDPSRMIDWLRAASGDVTTIGTEKVDGVETTHYRATVDLDKYPDLVPAEQQGPMRKAIDSLEKTTHVTEFPIHVWVGKADGLVRRVSTVLTQTIQRQTVNVVTSERFYDFGSPVDIALPSDDQVTDLTALATGTGG